MEEPADAIDVPHALSQEDLAPRLSVLDRLLNAVDIGLANSHLVVASPVAPMRPQEDGRQTAVRPEENLAALEPGFLRSIVPCLPTLAVKD
jgi:hypothetical protein